MHVLIALVLIECLCGFRAIENARLLRESRRLLRQMGSPLPPPRQSPTPNQLLGDVARPMAARNHFRQSR